MTLTLTLRETPSVPLEVEEVRPDRLLGRPADGPAPEGAQVKINMLLSRLPRLRDRAVRPEDAFAGTFHVNEGYDQLEAAYRQAAAGAIPEVAPCEIYCHSLTDPSVMGTLAMEGMHAFTFFGLHAPARLYSGHVEAQRDETVLRVLDMVNVYLEEPIENLVSLDQDGNPIESARGTVALCRCGKSRLRPFCDGSHKLVRFKAPSGAELGRQS